ncbi:golgin subfamily A member 2-like [Callithrix jacchus]
MTPGGQEQIEIFKMEKSQDAMKIEKLKGSLAHLQNLLEVGSPGLLPGLDIIIPARGMETPSHRVPFLNAAKASAQEEQARLCEQLQKQQVCCQHQAQLGASALKEPEAAAAATGTGSESGCGETQRALQGVINKLQRDFMDIVKENLDLKEWVEKLELGFIQLSGERDMIRKPIKRPEGQRAAPNSQHQEKEDVTQEEEGTRVKLLDRLEPVFQLMIDQEPQNPANKPPRSLVLLTRMNFLR